MPTPLVTPALAPAHQDHGVSLLSREGVLLSRNGSLLTVADPADCECCDAKTCVNCEGDLAGVHATAVIEGVDNRTNCASAATTCSNLFDYTLFDGEYVLTYGVGYTNSFGCPALRNDMPCRWGLVFDCAEGDEVCDSSSPLQGGTNLDRHISSIEMEVFDPPHAGIRLYIKSIRWESAIFVSTYVTTQEGEFRYNQPDGNVPIDCKGEQYVLQGVSNNDACGGGAPPSGFRYGYTSRATALVTFS